MVMESIRVPSKRMVVTGPWSSSVAVAMSGVLPSSMDGSAWPVEGNNWTARASTAGSVSGLRGSAVHDAMAEAEACALAWRAGKIVSEEEGKTPYLNPVGVFSTIDNTVPPPPASPCVRP